VPLPYLCVTVIEVATEYHATLTGFVSRRRWKM
jgi:hypothetical protein